MPFQFINIQSMPETTLYWKALKAGWQVIPWVFVGAYESETSNLTCLRYLTMYLDSSCSFVASGFSFHKTSLKPLMFVNASHSGLIWQLFKRNSRKPSIQGCSAKKHCFTKLFAKWNGIPCIFVLLPLWEIWFNKNILSPRLSALSKILSQLQLNSLRLTLPQV